MEKRLVKREDAGELVLNVLIWGVVSLLGIRLYLELMGYPQVGGGSWHIAHALWGGLIMVVGMMMTLIFHGGQVRKAASIVFGLGLGQFLDEIGKYLSRDNNYFFEPAIIIIYIFFVLLFLVYRYAERTSHKDPRSLLYQAINALEEVAEGDFENREKNKILKKLDIVSTEDNSQIGSFADKLKLLISETVSKEDRGEPWTSVLWNKIRWFGYHKVFRRKVIQHLLYMLAVVYVVSGITDTSFLAQNFGQKEFENLYYQGIDLRTRSDINILAMKVGAEIITSALLLAGIGFTLRNKLQKALTIFQYGLLVNIFLTSVFRFYFAQFSAVFGLFLSIAVYMGLKQMVKEV